ncbi:MAG: hypothetical protein IJ452_06690 [Butyricicoccus sp.]|nr:hypothetical protein [Butyricicoccus sp.]
MKVLKRLCAGLIAGVLLASSAAAAPVVKYDAVEAAADAKYDITVSDASIIAGNEYALLIAKWTKPATDPAVGGTVTTPTIDVTTLTYIDQTTAVADGTKGKVVFEDFIPKTVPDSVVLLGGEFAGDVTSPVVIGYIDAKGNLIMFAEIETTGRFAADLVFEMFEADAAVEEGSGTVLSATTSTEDNKKYSAEVLVPNAVTLMITKPKHTAYIIENITDENMGDIASLDIKIYAGDYNRDGSVDIEDFVKFANAYNSENESVDLTGDNLINIEDFVTFANGYNRKNVTTTLAD